MKIDGIKKKLKKAEVALVLSTLLASKPKVVEAKDRPQIEFSVEKWGNPEYIDRLYGVLSRLDIGLKEFLRDTDLHVVFLEGEDSADVLLPELGYQTPSSSIMGFTDPYNNNYFTIYVEGAKYDSYYDRYPESSKGLTKEEFGFKLVQSTLFHEIGHYIDSDGYSDRLSDSEDFITAFNYEVNNFTFTKDFNVDYLGIDTNINNSSEYFATAFSCYISYPEELKLHCPRTYNFFYNYINKLRNNYGYDSVDDKHTNSNNKTR